MRKLAPVFIAASVFAISSTAFAMGDKREKSAPSASTANATMPAGTSSGGTSAIPKNSTGASDATTSGASLGASSNNSTSGAMGTAMGGTAATTTSGTVATDMPDKSTSTRAKAATASNDATKCDVTRYASRTDMPKDCLDGKSGGAAVSSTQGQSGR